MMSAAFITLTRMSNVSSGTRPPQLPTQAVQQNVASNIVDDVTNEQQTSHVVQAGETLQGIANQYNISLENLIELNDIIDPNVLSAGQRLFLPTNAPVTNSVERVESLPVTRLIPDSELVFGPSAINFDLYKLVPQESYLRSYRGSVEGVPLDGIAIVQLVAERTRVHPRLLLAVLEHRAGWVTQSAPMITSEAMLGNTFGSQGLYGQLEWAANRLNLGYYGRGEGGLKGMLLADGEQVAFAPEINDATAGIQYWLAATANYEQWQYEVGSEGFIKTYKRLFNDPFGYEDTSFWPPTSMPDMRLPWEQGKSWYLTGGPHGGWIAGSGWAALDFVPPGDQFGCYESEEWVTAVADGVVTRSDFGAVMLDLDGDGYAGTGWAILYQHIATHERAAVGTKLRAGDPVGHPSCEGGVSSGTHLHIARTYNGRWVSADNDLYPFNLSGWVSGGVGDEYNGWLEREGVRRVATIGRLPENAISE